MPRPGKYYLTCIRLSVLSLMLVAFVIFSTNVAADPVPWNVVQKALQFRRDSVTSFRSQFQLELYFSESEIAKSKASALAAFGANPVPQEYLMPNRMYSAFWVSKDERWRAELTRLFPAEAGRHSNNYAVYDGEKYYGFNDFAGTGVVRANNLGHFEPFYDRELPLGGLGWPLSDLELVAAHGADFVLSGDETINGEKCAKYVAAGPNPTGKYRCSVWVCPAKGFAIVKFKQETYVEDPQKHIVDDGAVLVYSVQGLEQSNDTLFMPKSAKREYYQFIDRKLKWASTVRMTMQEVQLNGDVSDGFFEGRFPPGTKVVDYISAPGQVSITGGDFISKFETVQNNREPAHDEAEGSPMSVPESASKNP